MSTSPEVPLGADPAGVAAAYVAAWQARDWPGLRALLADDVTFGGPLGAADNAEQCLAGLRGMARTLERIEVHARLSDDSNVITWFDLHSTVAPPTPTANWTRVRGGKITAIRVVFDPRATLAGLAAGAADPAGAPGQGPRDGRGR